MEVLIGLIVFVVALVFEQKYLVPQRKRDRELRRLEREKREREITERGRRVRERQDRELEAARERWAQERQASEREKQRARELSSRLLPRSSRKGQRGREAPLTNSSDVRDGMDSGDAAPKASQRLDDLNQRLADVAEAYAAGTVTLEQMTLITARLKPEVQRAEADRQRHVRDIERQPRDPKNDYGPPDQVGTDT